MDAPPVDPPPPNPTDSDPPETGSPPAASAPPPRRLARRTDERLLGGVAGGVAEYLGVDVVLVRLGFVVTAFFGGVGVIAYIVGWIVLPEAPATHTEPRLRDRRQLLGYSLVGVGLLAVGGRLGWRFQRDDTFWPLALIALGAAVLWLRTRDVERESRPAPAMGSLEAADRVAALSTPDPITETVAEPSSAPMTAPMGPAASTPSARPARPRSYLGSVTWSCLLILAGAAWLLEASDVADVDLGVIVALALALVGVALLVSAWFGRSRGLIALGILLVLIVGGFGLVNVPLDGGIGDPTYHPRTLLAIDHEYTLAIGNLSVDLRGVDFAGSLRRVHARVGMGQLNVTVPTGVRVVVDGHAGIGGVTTFGEQSRECCPTDVHVVRPGSAGAGTLILDAQVGAGHVDITRRKESLRGTS